MVIIVSLIIILISSHRSAAQPFQTYSAASSLNETNKSAKSVNCSNKTAVGSNNISDDNEAFNNTAQTSSQGLASSTGLKIGGNPFKVAVNPNTNTIYVIDKFSKRISFIDGNTDRRIGTTYVTNIKPVTLGFNRSNITDFRSDIEINTQSNLAYVITTDSSIVSAIDSSDGNLVTSSIVKGMPFDLSINQGRIYVITDQEINPNAFNGAIYEINEYFNRIEGHSIPVSDDFLAAIKVASSADESIVYVIGGVTQRLYVYNNIPDSKPIANFSIPTHGYLYDLAVNPNTDTVYITDRSDTDIVYAVNITSHNITELHVGGAQGTTGVVVNPKTNMVYVGNPGCRTVSVINGTSNSFVTNIPVDIEPRGLDINPNTNMVYVANWLSGTISVIDGVKNKLTTVSRFNVNPPNAGFIECNGNKISSNYSRYYIDTSLECEAKANDGFTFSSWSGDYLPSSNLNTPLTTFKVSKYGTLSANFIQSSTVSIPPEFWTPLYGLIPGFFIPSIISWLNGRMGSSH